MKPHPRIRKTVKWGGLALSIAVLAIDAASLFFVGKLTVFSALYGEIVYGRFRIGYYEPWSAVPLPHTSRFIVERNHWVGATPDWTTFLFGSEVMRRLPSGGYAFGWTEYEAPLLYPFVLLVVPTAWLWWVDRRRARVQQCPNCNYDRTGLAAGAVCPECGSGVNVA